MGRSFHFLLTFLPSLPELGGRPGVTPAELRELTRGDGAAARVVDAVLLEADVLARESALAGETDSPEGVVLTNEQVRGEAPLPDFLDVDPENRRVPVDAVWEAYYRHVARIAGRAPSGFLRGWVGFDVALRNSIAAERARTLELEPADYLVAEDIADDETDVTDIVTAWAAAADPLRALQVLDEARFAWAAERGEYFSFALDEVAAYAARLLLSARWDRLMNEQNRDESSNAA